MDAKQPCPLKVPPHLARQVAVAALCDPRPAERFIRGEKVNSLTAMRITKALAAHPELAKLVRAARRANTPESA